MVRISSITATSAARPASDTPRSTVSGSPFWLSHDKGIEMQGASPEHPAVAYLISWYNHLPYLERSIGSALAQRYSRVELLVCDDCSTDGSRELLDRLSREHGFTV